MSDQLPAPPPRPPITDSIWFWVLLFSAAGCICLILITPRYQPRQRRLEMQYQAREEILRRRAEGEPAARETGLEGDATPPGATDLIIPLWPLLAGCVLMLLVSTVMLARSRGGTNVSHSESRGGES